MTRTPTPSRLNGPTRVLHVITGLDVGGAEVNLHRLLATLDPTRFEAAVVSLTTAGVMAEKISTLGIPVHALGLRECCTASGFLDSGLTVFASRRWCAETSVRRGPGHRDGRRGMIST